MSKRLTRESKSVAHHSPGRTRLKVPKSQRKHLHKIKDALVANPGVKNVEINHQTGSVLVHHEHETPIFEVMHKAVESVEADLLTALIEGEAVELAGVFSIAAAGVGLLGSIGKGLLDSAGQGGKLPTLISGQASDLKTVVPAAFLIAACYKAYQSKTFWQGLTPMALAYWAFDTYWRFNVANPAVFEPKNGKAESAAAAKKHEHN